MSENQASASVQSEGPSFIEVSLNSERAARHSEVSRREQMTGAIELAEQRTELGDGLQNRLQQSQELQEVSDSQNSVRQLVPQAPWTSAVVEQQLDMMPHAAARYDDEDSSSRHRQRASCCCIGGVEECWGSPPFCSATREVGCVCATCCFGCDIEEEDLEAHIQCINFCHLLREVMQKVEPCVKVSNPISLHQRPQARIILPNRPPPIFPRHSGIAKPSSLRMARGPLECGRGRRIECAAERRRARAGLAGWICWWVTW
jgi:hypothetical protein